MAEQCEIHFKPIDWRPIDDELQIMSSDGNMALIPIKAIPSKRVFDISPSIIDFGEISYDEVRNNTKRCIVSKIVSVRS